MQKRMVQLVLQHGGFQTVAWVEDRSDLKVGNFCTLKDDPREWKIHFISGPIEKSEINRTWHVGGL